MTPKFQLYSSQRDSKVFSSIGSNIMRRTDMNYISNKKVFSVSGGLGPANIGTEDWLKAKNKQDRI